MTDRSRARAQVAQLVEHATENRSVGGSIPSLGTTEIRPANRESGNDFYNENRCQADCDSPSENISGYRQRSGPRED